MTAANTIEEAPVFARAPEGALRQVAPAAPFARDESSARSTLRSPTRDGWASHISASTYALSASTLSFLATGVALGVRGRRELDHLHERCGELSCGHGDAALGRRLYVAADVVLGLSAALSLATLWSFFVGDRESDQRAFRAAHDASAMRYVPSFSITPQRGTLAFGASF